MVVDHTSQLSRIVQRATATDLSGGKVTEALSTVGRSILAAAVAVGFRVDWSLGVVASPRTRSGAVRFPATSVRGGS